jgi:hypothetical protein
MIAYAVAISSADSSTNTRPPEFANPTALAAAGISSVLQADDAGGAYPFVLAGAARLLVDEAGVEDAAAVMSEHPDADRKEQR